MTPADIQIDLPSSGDHLACTEVTHTKDSFGSLMKGFLPQCFFKPKSTYFILYFDCCNGLIYEVTSETCISLVVLKLQSGQEINLKISRYNPHFSKMLWYLKKINARVKEILNFEIKSNLSGKCWQKPNVITNSTDRKQESKLKLQS